MFYYDKNTKHGREFEPRIRSTRCPKTGRLITRGKHNGKKGAFGSKRN